MFVVKPRFFLQYASVATITIDSYLHSISMLYRDIHQLLTNFMTSVIFRNAAGHSGKAMAAVNLCYEKSRKH